MGILEIRALKEKKGSVMTVEEAKKFFAKGGSANVMAGKFHSGQYECSKGSVYFRSKWEANYSLFLDWLKEQKKIKDWEYESETYVFGEIKKGTKTYKIDFKVWLSDTVFEIHEIKGYLDPKSKTKLRRMAKYFPNVKLVLIDGKAYNEILKKMGKIIRFY